MEIICLHLLAFFLKYCWPGVRPILLFKKDRIHLIIFVLFYTF